MSSMESSHLPSEIIYEIFLRASNDTLGRCRVASKEWNQTTYDSKFNKLHSQLANIVDGFFAQHMKIPYPRTRFSKEAVAISVTGLNPFRYKILLISSSQKEIVKNHRMLICEVFDSETWTWKRLKNIVLAHYKLFDWGPAITVRGAFHWLMHPDLVFSFDVEEEEWKIHGLPVKADDYYCIKLVEYKGKLALICVDSEGYMHTWVLENYKNQVWKNKFGINVKDPDTDYREYSPLAFYGSDVIVVRKRESLMYCDFKNGNVLKEANLKKDIFPILLFPIWSDSEPCCLRRPLESGIEEEEEEDEAQ